MEMSHKEFIAILNEKDKYKNKIKKEVKIMKRVMKAKKIKTTES